MSWQPASCQVVQ